MEIRLLNKEILKKTNIEELLTNKAPATDVAILNGADIDIQNYAYGYKDFKDRSADYWLEDNEDGLNAIVRKDGHYSEAGNFKILGVRPVFKYSEIKQYCKEERNLNHFILATTDFEYPQYAIDDSICIQKEKLIPTGKIYSIGEDSCPEYIFGDEKIIYVPKNKKAGFNSLSDQVSLCNRLGRWCKVDKVQVLIDKENDIAISKNILFLSQREKKIGDKHNVSFKESYLYKFMNQRLVLDLTPSHITKKITTLTIEENQVKELLNNKEVLLNNGDFKLVLEKSKVKKL